MHIRRATTACHCWYKDWHSAADKEDEQGCERNFDHSTAPYLDLSFMVIKASSALHEYEMFATAHIG
jgi:hypothetical protein